MLRLLERRRRSNGHPTPQAAYAALSEGMCLYASVNACSGRPLRQVGLRDNDDNNVVLCCHAHYGRLRRMKPRDLDRLERDLLHAFRKGGHAVF